MLNVKIICVGKLKEAYWQSAVAEYTKRLSRFMALEIVELPEERLPESPSAAQIDAALSKEGAAIIKRASGALFPLCVEGRPVSSEELAERLESAMQSPGQASFIIGSSFGLSAEVKKMGEQLSFSRLTLPHQLCRILLTEQLYRAGQIITGGKYHK